MSMQSRERVFDIKIPSVRLRTVMGALFLILSTGALASQLHGAGTLPVANQSGPSDAQILKWGMDEERIGKQIVALDQKIHAKEIKYQPTFWEKIKAHTPFLRVSNQEMQEIIDLKRERARKRGERIAIRRKLGKASFLDQYGRRMIKIGGSIVGVGALALVAKLLWMQSKKRAGQKQGSVVSTTRKRTQATPSQVPAPARKPSAVTVASGGGAGSAGAKPVLSGGTGSGSSDTDAATGDQASRGNASSDSGDAVHSSKREEAPLLTGRPGKPADLPKVSGSDSGHISEEDAAGSQPARGGSDSVSDSGEPETGEHAASAGSVVDGDQSDHSDQGADSTATAHVSRETGPEAGEDAGSTGTRDADGGRSAGGADAEERTARSRSGSQVSVTGSVDRASSVDSASGDADETAGSRDVEEVDADVAAGAGGTDSPAGPAQDAPASPGFLGAVRGAAGKAWSSVFGKRKKTPEGQAAEAVEAARLRAQRAADKEGIDVEIVANQSVTPEQEGRKRSDSSASAATPKAGRTKGAESATPKSSGMFQRFIGSPKKSGKNGAGSDKKSKTGWSFFGSRGRSRVKRKLEPALDAAARRANANESAGEEDGLLAEKEL